MQEISASSLGLNTTEQMKYAEMSSREDVVQMKPVQIGDISTNIQGDVLKFALPGYGQCKYVIDMAKPYHGGTVLSGKQVNGSGQFIYVDLPEGKGAYFQMNNRFFTLFPAKNGRAVVIESNLYSPNGIEVCDSGTTTNGPTISSSPSSAPPTANFCSSMNTCAAVTTALVLVTPEATSFFASFGNPYTSQIMAAMGMHAFNISLLNSGVVNKEVDFVVSTYSTTLTEDIAFDRNELKTDGTVTTLMNDNYADVVIMLTDARYISLLTGNDVFGQADIGPCNDCYTAIVEAPSMFSSRWTLAHELGHIFGARHNTDENINNPAGDNTEGCQHGFQFVDAAGNTQNTVMGLLGDDGIGRSLHFSNPTIPFMGIPTETATGTAGTEDNARYISHSSCVVANYMPNQFNIMIGGQACIAVGDMTPYTAEVISPSDPSLPGYGPYTYEWKYIPEANGTYFPFNPAQTNSTLVIPNDLFNFDYFWLQLTVTSADGIELVTTRKINVAPCFTGGHGTDNRNATRHNIEHLVSNNILIYPNPNSGLFNISLENTAVDTAKELFIFNSCGEQVFKERNFSLKSTTLNLQDYQKGIYIIRIVTNEETLSSKFIIQ